MYLHELEELINILNEIEPEETTRYFTDEESLELYETCIHLMETYILENPKAISEPDFDEIFDDNIYDLIYSQFQQEINEICDLELEISDIIEEARADFFKDFIPPRSYSLTFIIEEPDFDYIDEQITYLRNQPQPTQRTKEWYEMRHNLITASNAYKAFENQNVQNQLIFEKCQPMMEMSDDILTTSLSTSMVNVNTTLHWGQKYEPLSVKIYEHVYNTKVGDFGCIKHNKYHFLGASPDGINIDRNSKRYGRMLEIKNIVNREIDGIPKKEYWIQMQLQMEVCDLEECDFLETKFVEYENEEDFLNDIDEYIENYPINKTETDERKGVIIYFAKKDGNPIYEYMPLTISTYEEYNNWTENMVEYYSKQNINFIKFIYWKLETISCVLVVRNHQWFHDNIHELQEIWSIIEKERITGYEHRAPSKRVKKEGLVESSNYSQNIFQYDKLLGKIVVKKLDIILEPEEINNITEQFNNNEND